MENLESHGILQFLFPGDSILQHHGPEHCFLYHLTRSLNLVNICMTDVYSGIQWNIYVKPFDIPLPLTCF